MLKLYVFDSSITPIGIVDVVTCLTWTKQAYSCGSFELYCPLDRATSDLLSIGNLLWKGDTSAGVIELREMLVGDDGIRTLHVSGRLIECYLDYRVVYPVYSATGAFSQTVCGLVDKNCINPEDEKRKIPLLKLDPAQVTISESISFQQTGGSVMEQVSELCTANNVSFEVKFVPDTKELLFSLRKGVDRTMEQKDVPPVLVSSEFDDILESQYFANESENKNFAYVAGEGEGSARKYVTVGDSSGLSRKELFVDARDLQSTNPDGSDPIPEDEYLDMLTERGKSKLSEYPSVESFEATVRTFATPSYVFGVDYFLGDTVSVIDSRLGLKTSAVVTSSTQTYDEDGYKLELSFGYSQPTLIQKIKRRNS